MSLTSAPLAAAADPHSGPGAGLQIFVVLAIIAIAVGAFFLVSAYRDHGPEE